MKEMKQITNLKPVDLNCSIFSVYDYNGLSMNELLCQFFTKINECIEGVNTTTNLVDWLINVGLKEEVANKLNQWLIDGTLSSLINETLLKEINEKLDNLNKRITVSSYLNISDLKLDSEENYNNAFDRYFEKLKNGEKIGLLINVSECIVTKNFTLPYNKYISIIGSGYGNSIVFNGTGDLFSCIKGNLGETEEDNVYLQGEIRNLNIRTLNNENIMLKQLKGYTSNFSIGNCIISGFKHAVWCEKAWWFNVYNCDIINGVNGITLFDANSSRIVNTFFRFLTGTGVTYKSDEYYKKSGTAGICLDKVNFEKVECGIHFDARIYGGDITNCYWECNLNKPSITMSDTATLNCFTFNSNFARTDNKFYVKTMRNVTFNGGHMPMVLPETSDPFFVSKSHPFSIMHVVIINSDEDYYAISNYNVHNDQIFKISFKTYSNKWNLLTSNAPLTSCKDELTLEPNQEYVIAYAKYLKDFKLINVFGDDIFKATIKVTKEADNGETEELFNVKHDTLEGSLYKPLFHYNEPTSAAFIIKVKIVNEESEAINLKQICCNYSFNCYKS